MNPSSTQRLTILLVDDEPSIRLSVGDVLEREGHRVDRATNGAEAIERVSRASFDLVITDVNMPHVDGLTLLRRIRSSHPSTDVMVITAYGDESNVVTAIKDGREDYVAKPFTNDEIVERVRRVWARRQTHKPR